VENSKQDFFGFVTLAGMDVLQQVLNQSRTLLRSGGHEVKSATRSAVDFASERSNIALDESMLEASALLELTGYGVLQPYLDDESIEEIAINRPGEIHTWTSKGHTVSNLELSQSTIRTLTMRMLSHSGRRVDRLTPYVDAVIKDGSRLHVVIPELTRDYWSLNIRKFRKSAVDLQQLRDSGTLSGQHFEQLCYAMANQKSILISGATQAGKTTLMTALLNQMSPDERLVSCEDTFEISVGHNDWVAMQTRPASSEGALEVTLRELVRQSLRMRPTRLVIGEVRGAEALDMLVALNSGIPGLCTIHANSAKAAIRKLLTLPLLAGDNITESFLRPTILSAFDLVVFCQRTPDGNRRVEEILEVSDALFQ
jgi:pilus assembly protein CpaF